MSSFLKSLTVNNQSYSYYSLKEAEKAGYKGIEQMPFSLKVLIENLLRYQAPPQNVEALIQSAHNSSIKSEISFYPARVLMQDFTGVPAVVDLAAMRDAIGQGDSSKVNPLVPVDLVIDHSVMVDFYGSPDAFSKNVQLEFARNKERYTFLKWGQKAFRNFRVVPPGTGICHQVNLEYLAQGVWTSQDASGRLIAYPDSLVGTDSHTTMVNGLSVLGWGVGGIEAEAVMLGQPLSMVIPQVVGVKLTGTLPEGTSATDLVLTITHILRKKGVVGKFVEFFGDGLNSLSLADRATVANMAPEYGATCGFFPIDQETIKYLHLTGRDPERIALVEAYAKEQGLWRIDDPYFHDVVELDLSCLEPTLAGPKRPQDKVCLKESHLSCSSLLQNKNASVRFPVKGQSFDLGHGDIVLAAITSCTNTSNPSVMLTAGLLAKKARQLGLQTKPWVKTSLAPGSQVVRDYLEKAHVLKDLQALGFDLVGYGCTTCIGNSGPLNPEIAEVIDQKDLMVCAILSGNRNFEGRVHPQIKANYLASPAFVVAYALCGTMLINLEKDPLGYTDKPIYLKDIWPSKKELDDVMASSITRDMFQNRYKDVFKGEEEWQTIEAKPSLTYSWDKESTYIQNPPYFRKSKNDIKDIKSARILALLGDSITTDHISPAGSIKKDSPAGQYLQDHGIVYNDFNSYGSRRGNHDVMMRGTFANIRLQNEMTPDQAGGWTKYLNGEEKTLPIYNASMCYQKDNTSLVVIAGKEYGTGSSRDWAAKGTYLLGVKAILAESFERIHRSNLVGMGVLPLVFPEGINRKSLGLTGKEHIDILGLDQGLKPGMTLICRIHYPHGQIKDQEVLCRVDTQEEVSYFEKGGILPYVLEKLS
ncbi:MAG: aconitate hydratase AcnA [Proteobacteria bacterium]|nr:aconitate hydratase AcnA [Pseudomonadota bacterium]